MQGLNLGLGLDQIRLTDLPMVSLTAGVLALVACPVKRACDATLVGSVLDVVIPRMVAFWDFSEASAPFLSKNTLVEHALVVGGGSFTKSTDANIGDTLVFNGSSYLKIDSANLVDLNLGRTSNKCTVLAWVKRADLNIHFIAGCWEEDDVDGKRQYGLFLDLPEYGGADRVCGHVSKTGDPTPGYPYSRDYANSAKRIGTGKWELVAMTYDGALATSYIRGAADSIPDGPFTDSLGNTYAKNPYVFLDGLNDAELAEFTVGGCVVDNVIANRLNGELARLKVYNYVLSPDEIMEEVLAVTPSGGVIIDWDFYFNSTSPIASGSAGWTSIRDATAVDMTFVSPASDTESFAQVALSGNTFLYRNGATDSNSTRNSFSYTRFPKLPISILDEIEFELNFGATADYLQFAVEVDGQWYLNTTQFSVSAAGTGADWTNAEVKTFDPKVARYDILTAVTGETLAVTSAGIPLTGSFITGIGFYSPIGASSAHNRIRNIKLKRV